MNSWLFRLMFPRQRALMWDAARQNAKQELGALYEKKFSTLQRSPIDESKWVARFVALDEDYEALEKETAEARIENAYLKMQLRKLEDSK
jgi:hypothetical protein